MRASIFAVAMLLGLTSVVSAGDPTPLIRGHFDLRDARTGRGVSQKSFNGSYRLVFFGFTHCPLTCPLGLRTVEAVLAKLGQDASGVKAIFITVDPARDTAKTMADYLGDYDPRIIGLVGSEKAIAAAMREFRLEAERMGTGDNYLLEHPAIVYFMGKNGEYLATLPSRGDADKIANQVREAMKK